MYVSQRRICLQILGTLVIICSASVLPAQIASNQLVLWSVRTSSRETSEDLVLKRVLEDSAKVRIDGQYGEPYAEVIRKLTGAEQKENTSYLARVPPYVFVAAEMLGADIQPLATYQSSSTTQLTYNSWFVVKRSKLRSAAASATSTLAPEEQSRAPRTPPIPTSTPTLDDVVKFIESRRSNPVKFVYHDKFSTSSYFLPALFFRSKNIFSIAQPEDASKDFIPIHSEKVNVSGSSDLITMVANDQADLAAVWDGTIKKYTQPNDDVVFISLPYAVPNDLLVCSKKLNDQTKDSITRAIDNKTFRSTAEEMGKTNDLGDVYSWVTMGRAPAAEQALANLRHLAQIDAYGVTVRVSSPGGSLVSQASLDAINRGIKLSQTEFVPYDPAYHKHADYNWTVSSTHDGAISLSSEIDGFDIEPQVIPISFTDAEDLSKRVSQLIHSRLHRIRYIWPYEDETPTVIRDFDFAISAGSLIRARKVVWQDPRIDAATRDLAFDVNVVKSDFHTLRLNGFILQHDRSLGFDPMSNVSYQVLLIRPNDESLMFKTMTYGFVIVLGLAALAAIYDFRRRTRAAVPEAAQGDLKQMYRSTLARYYKSWRATSSDGKREIAGANVIWCNRAFLEKFIAGLKNSAQINSTVRIQTGWNLFAKIPLIKDYVGLGAGVERSIDYTWIYDPTAVDDPERLSGVVPFLIESELLAPFVGTQLEWEALNIIALNAVQRNQVTPQVTLNGHNKVLSRDNPFLQSLVSQHFHEVLDLSLPRAAFFNQTWQLTAENDGQRIFQYHESINYQNGSDSTSADRMVLSFTLPKEAFLNGDLVDGKLSAWLLGRIQKRDIDLENGARSLRIEFKPLALLKE